MYRYEIRFECQKGTVDHAEPLVAQDLAPIVEDARFVGLREGLVTADESLNFQLRPILLRDDQPDFGGITVLGFEVLFPGHNGSFAYRKRYWLDSFRQLALEKARRLPNCEAQPTTCPRLSYWIEALPTGDTAGEGGADSESRPLLSKLAFKQAEFPLEVFRLRAKEALLGVSASTAQEPFPLFIPRGALAEMRVLARDNIAREVAGFLLGEVYQHYLTSEIFGVIQDFVPARTNQATATSVHLDGNTWQAFWEEKRLRYPDSRLLGWWHSHPCEATQLPAGCEAPQTGHEHDPAPERHRSGAQQGETPGRVSTLFLSEQDLFIHRRFFSTPYCVCMVVDPHAPVGEDMAIWGWRDGLLTARNAYVL